MSPSHLLHWRGGGGGGGGGRGGEGEDGVLSGHISKQCDIWQGTCSPVIPDIQSVKFQFRVR